MIARAVRAAAWALWAASWAAWWSTSWLPWKVSVWRYWAAWRVDGWLSHRLHHRMWNHYQATGRLYVTDR